MFEGLRVTIDLDLNTEEDPQDTEASKMIHGLQIMNMNLMRTSSAALKGQPVDLVIDLSLITKDDVKENMKTWAYLMLLNDQSGLNVNFIFENIRNTEFVEDPISALKGYIDELSEDFGRDAEEIKARVNQAHPEVNTIRAHILRPSDLETLTDSDPLLVLMDEQKFLSNSPMWDFAAAYAVVLAQASLKKTVMESSAELGTQRVERLLKDLLPKLRMVYKRKFPGHDLDLLINNDVLMEMVDGDITRRKKIAEWLALPPITRRAASLLLRESHMILQSFLRAA